MPSTIVVNCPDCDKEMKVPAELEGKKIRCKVCGETFVVRAPRKAAKVAKKAEAPKVVRAKPKAPAKPAKPAPSGHDDEEGSNPYGVTEESMAARCPHCAGEMESEDAIICLHCGYNTMTRERINPTMTIEHTPADWILWLLPAILCILLILGCIGCIVFLFVWLNDIIEAYKNEWWAFAPRSFQLWGTIFNLFLIFFAGRFAIKRLIFNPRPPEKIKGK
jgi:hypothetical protein